MSSKLDSGICHLKNSYILWLSLSLSWMLKLSAWVVNLFFDNAKWYLWGFYLGYVSTCCFLDTHPRQSSSKVWHFWALGTQITAWKWWSKVAGGEVCWDYNLALHTWSQWIIWTSAKSTKFWWWARQSVYFSIQWSCWSWTVQYGLESDFISFLASLLNCQVS